MSGATGAAGGGAAPGRQGSPSAASRGGQPDPQSAGRPGEHQAATSVMPSMPDGPGQAQPGQGTPGAHRSPAGPAGPAGGAGLDGYSQPTTYSKGQPASARTRSGPPSPRSAAHGTARRPAPGAPAPAAAWGRTRKARLRVAKADPWSVMKVSFLLSIAFAVVTVVAVAMLWTVLDVLGVISTVGGTLKEATGSGSDSSGGFDLQSTLSFGNVMFFSLIVAIVDVVLMTALATLGAFIYNTAADFTGGVELTLAEDEV